MGVEVVPCQTCNGSGHVGWFRLRPCTACKPPQSQSTLTSTPLPSGTAGVDVWNAAIEEAARACENRAASYTDLHDTSLRNEAGKCASAIRMRLRDTTALATGTRAGEQP